MRVKGSGLVGSLRSHMLAHKLLVVYAVWEEPIYRQRKYIFEMACSVCLRSILHPFPRQAGDPGSRADSKLPRRVHV